MAKNISALTWAQKDRRGHKKSYVSTKGSMWAQKKLCEHKRIDVGTKNKFVELIFENSKQFLIFHEQIPSIL